MALLFEMADYSLDQLISIPEEKACTSMDRRWAVPSGNSSAKQPVMGAAVPKNLNSKKDITCTLYNPQMSGTDTGNSFTNCLEVLKQNLTSKSNLTGIIAANISKNTALYKMRHMS